ncbi:uncharacterized protein [Paramisgurnus dabryanus]|uniref:uncharacterized protein n=1 Tax=Paramisgurnus dabryanus TaxID=90735 RepID=UPI0031F346FF
MDPADTESGCSATARLSTTAQEEDSAFTAHRNHHARLLFGMRQRGAEIRSFASRFLEEARLAGLSGRELKVIFYACLDEPLRSSEVELLKPLDFFDMVNYVRNRPEPKSRPLSPVPEGRVVGRMVLESSAPTTSSSISSAPPASLRGSRLAIRGRGIQTGAIRLGRSTLISPALETTPAPDLHPALPVSGQRKKDSSALQPAATPQSSEKAAASVCSAAAPAVCAASAAAPAVCAASAAAPAVCAASAAAPAVCAASAAAPAVCAASAAAPAVCAANSSSLCLCPVSAAVRSGPCHCPCLVSAAVRSLLCQGPCLVSAAARCTPCHRLCIVSAVTRCTSCHCPCLVSAAVCSGSCDYSCLASAAVRCAPCHSLHVVSAAGRGAPCHCPCLVSAAVCSGSCDCSCVVSAAGHSAPCHVSCFPSACKP